MKESKRSLLTSLTSLLHCFVMLIGTTFAWFTDEVTSANNIIKAGKLDIGMHWSTDNSNWANAEGINADPVFDYDNWEAGYTEVRYIKVTNEGNLAFKYQMFINPTGTVGKLAEVWEANGITLTNDKGSGSNVADYANPARFYKSSKITIDCAGMTKIEFECNNSSYATALKSSIDTSNCTVSVSGSTVTVEFVEAVDTFVIASLGGQVRMNSLTVTAKD